VPSPGHDRGHRGYRGPDRTVDRYGGFNKSHKPSHTTRTGLPDRGRASRRTTRPSSCLRRCPLRSATPTTSCATSTSASKTSVLNLLPPDRSTSPWFSSSRWSTTTGSGSASARSGTSAAGAIEAILARADGGRAVPLAWSTLRPIERPLASQQTVLEALIDAGACDSLGDPPSWWRRSTPRSGGPGMPQERQVGQHACLASRLPALVSPAPHTTSPTCLPGPRTRPASSREAVLGFFISGHPLAR